MSKEFRDALEASIGESPNFQQSSWCRKCEAYTSPRVLVMGGGVTPLFPDPEHQATRHDVSWCSTCHPPENDFAMGRRERELEKALALADLALLDWMIQYAPDECSAEHIEAARERVMAKGGTLAYIAAIHEQNYRILKED